MQENEIELPLLEKGEFSLRSPYLQVNSPQWIRMTEKQKKQALAKIHSINVDDTVETRESRITTAALNETDPILHQFLQAAVDWTPRDVLAFKTKKAAEIHSSGAIVQLNSNEAAEIHSSGAIVQLNSSRLLCLQKITLNSHILSMFTLVENANVIKIVPVTLL